MGSTLSRLEARLKLSIIMPVRNEAAGIVAALTPLQPLRGELELILVDGGSIDETLALAAPLVDQLIQSEPGRATQMNAGAALAHGDWLLFLHADTCLPNGFIGLLPEPGSPHRWGRFDVRLSPSSPLLAVVAWMMNLRSRLTAVCTGDQAIFVERRLFDQFGGYAPIALMEDIELSKRLRRQSRPLCLSERLTTSSRRWQQNGTLRTIALMWQLRLRYWLGADPSELARQYSGRRN
ncbi:TIGR04283 family arsenosugar biosynthesis glycosyltransferase [Halopseudomonas oceani]|uniref:Glycosyl transferase n=1 Tax=Halopseudomonas oceani TaxID=1708783 RepID=A0A2P4EXI1_9GAMM|nr:TIGR04283 family arsenosugar biosynthesis glycosyltransferase [Halopseudomonas oceani]POB04718.1 glycosyl transferase [Halopseudomonas oceani]